MLKLCKNEVAEVKALKAHPYLHSLHLTQNKLKSLSGLESASLKELHDRMSHRHGYFLRLLPQDKISEHCCNRSPVALAGQEVLALLTSSARDPEGTRRLKTKQKGSGVRVGRRSASSPSTSGTALRASPRRYV